MSVGHLSAVEDRPLPLRKRGDLDISTSWFQGEQSWIVKDPVSLKYHRLREAEMIVLRMLDGQTTLREIKESLQDRFPTKIARLSDLQHLLSSLFRAGMLLSDAPGQAEQLLKRHRETRGRELRGRLSNVLAIRFPGFDPEWILNRLNPWFGWIFGPTGRTVWCIVALTAASLLLGNIDEFRRRLPNFQDFFAAQNFMWLAIVMAVTKICHEFGHGLSCKYFDGECHEIGVMLLVFTPAMYCDTSDSWLLPNKWHRAFIGAAGMYVEVFLASLATFVWWYTQPGVLNFMCLNVMFVSSVSTVVFNANPLLRYDGYYILSDILEIPNLAQKSRLAMLNLLRVVCLGLKSISPRQLPQRNHLTFALYSVASFCYRWFVLVMITWFVSKVFEPYGLQIIGQIIIAMSVVGLVIVPLWKLGQFFMVPGRIQEVKMPRLIVSIIIVTLFAAAIAFVPVPNRIITSVVIRPDNAGRVYATVPGRLKEILVQPGDKIEAGQPLAKLENIDSELSLTSLESERIQQESHLKMMKFRQVDDPSMSGAIPHAQAVLDDINTRLAERRKDLDRLVLVAENAGTIMPPPELPESSGGDELETWSGTPFDPENLNLTMEAGQLFCMVGDPGKMNATLVFDQSYIELIKSGQEVEILLDELPDRQLTGTIREVAKIDMQSPPRELTLAAGGPLATAVDRDTGEQKLMFVMYEASVPLHDLDVELLNGFRGHAKIHLEREPLWRRIVRFTRNTVHFR